MREVDRGQCYSVGWTTYAGEKTETFYAESDDVDEEVKVGQTVEMQDKNQDDNTQHIGESKNESDEISNQKDESIDGDNKDETNNETVENKEITQKNHSPIEQEVITENIEQPIDMCVFITPRKVTSDKEKKSGFFRKAKDKSTASGAGVLPSMLLMKDFHSVENAKNPTQIISPTGCPDEFDHVFGGGPLICITSRIVSKEGTANNAVSQIELEAALSEEASRGANNTKVNEDILEIPPYQTYKSQFYYLSIDELSEKSNVADKFVMTPIGPPMAEASMISWDVPQITQFTADGAEIFTQNVAILIHNRINIVALKGITAVAAGRSRSRTRSRSSSKYKKQSSMSMLFSAAPVLDKISLTCIASCQVGALPYDKPTSLFWDNGTLFASTPFSVYAVFPIAQIANRYDTNDESGGGAKNENVVDSFSNCFHESANRLGHMIQWGGSMADALQVSSVHSLVPNATWHRNNLSPGEDIDSSLPHIIPMPYGHVEIVGVSKGQLLLAMRDTSVAAVSLCASPMVILMTSRFK